MRKEDSGLNGSLSVSQHLFIPKNGGKNQCKIIYIIHENCKRGRGKSCPAMQPAFCRCNFDP